MCYKYYRHTLKKLKRFNFNRTTLKTKTDCVLLFTDAPVIKSVGPDRLTTASLYSQAVFNCEAESHPLPSYQWLQRASPSSGPEAVVRASESRLVLRNVTYEHQGEYVCKVTNLINGRERTVQSEPVSLQVVGECFKK